MSVLGVLYAIAIAQQALWLAVSVPVTIGLGATIRGIAFGAPKLLGLKVRGVHVTIGPLPTSSIDMDSEQLAALPLSRKLGIRLLPWVVTFGVAIACLGPGHAARSFLHAFSQLLLVLDPTALVERFLTLVETAPTSTTFGIVLAKVAALNLLPFMMLAGGGVITDVLESRGIKAPKWWIVLSLAGVLYTGLRFIWATAHAL